MSLHLLWAWVRFTVPKVWFSVFSGTERDFHQTLIHRVISSLRQTKQQRNTALQLHTKVLTSMIISDSGPLSPLQHTQLHRVWQLADYIIWHFYIWDVYQPFLLFLQYLFLISLPCSLSHKALMMWITPGSVKQVLIHHQRISYGLIIHTEQNEGFERGTSIMYIRRRDKWTTKNWKWRKGR